MSEISSSTAAVRQAASQLSAAPPLAFDFLDLKAQHAEIRYEVMEAMLRVMESQQFILGSEVSLFEQETASLLGAKHAIACASGTDALVLAMMALGIGAEDEVITSPFSFFATAGSIARVGARPVFVDIEPGTFNIDPELIPAAITSKTRAIMPVHLFGLPAELDPIVELANRHGLAIVEDAAQAIGAQYRGRSAGIIGSAGCFSFFPSKNLGGAGDGGLITTEDPALDARLRMLRVHGSKKKYHHELLGMNSRLDALQASILRVKLRHLGDWTRARQSRAQFYGMLFGETSLGRLVVLPEAPAQCVHVYNQFSIRCRQRDSLREFLRRSGIPTEIYYPLTLHLQPAFEYLGYRAGQFPVAEEASQEVLSLPVYPELKEEQQRFIVRTIESFYGTKEATQTHR